MILDFDELKYKFRQPLPGLQSHLKMSPAHRAQELLEMQTNRHLARQSAVLILLYPVKQKLKTVFIKRSEYEGVHSGQIAFPGGKKEDLDKTFVETALRETLEEIGVEASKIEIIGQLSDLFIPPSNFLVQVFVGYCTEKPVYILDKKEVQSTIEVDMDEFYNEENIREKEFGSNSLGLKIKAPYFKVNKIEIWGATAMIVSELMDVLKK